MPSCPATQSPFLNPPRDAASVSPLTTWIPDHAPSGVYGGLGGKFGALNYDYSTAPAGQQASDLTNWRGRLSSTRLVQVGIRVDLQRELRVEPRMNRTMDRDSSPPEAIKMWSSHMIGLIVFQNNADKKFRCLIRAPLPSPEDCQHCTDPSGLPLSSTSGHAGPISDSTHTSHSSSSLSDRFTDAREPAQAASCE